MMERPNDDAVCAQCNHRFGVHAITYDRMRSGCLWMQDSQTDGTMMCRCDGFFMRVYWPPVIQEAPPT